MSDDGATPVQKRTTAEVLSEERVLRPPRRSESSQPLTSFRDAGIARLVKLGLETSQFEQISSLSTDEIDIFVFLFQEKCQRFEDSLQLVQDSRVVVQHYQMRFVACRLQSPNITVTDFYLELANRAEELANRAEELANRAEESANRAEELANRAEESANRAEESANRARERANRAEEQLAEARQDAAELSAIICCQSSRTLVFTEANVYSEAYTQWAKHWTTIPSLSEVYEKFKFELILGEVSRSASLDPKRIAMCESAESLFNSVFVAKDSASNSQEAVTQRFWTSLLRAVQAALGDQVDMLDVHDTSTASFVGSNEQPDISLAPRNMSCESFTFVQKIAELKIKGQRGAGVSQIISRARDLRLLKGLASYEIEGAVADDTALDILRCVLSPSGPKVWLVATVKLSDDWASVIQAIAALLSNKLVSGEQELQPRESGRLGSTNVVATLQRMDNKPAVWLEKDPDGLIHVVKKKHHLWEAYFTEKTNLETVRCGMSKMNVRYPTAAFDDSSWTITFDFVGHRVRMHTDDQVRAAFRQLEEQLGAAHNSGMWRGDISPRNIVMCMTSNASPEQDETRRYVANAKNGSIDEWVRGAAAAAVEASRSRQRVVDYYLIDWGEAETISSDQKQGRAVTLQCSYPLSSDASPEVFKRRDCYALRCSLIILYAESAKLGEDWWWNGKFEADEERRSLRERYMRKRKHVLSRIAAENEANPFPKFVRSLAKDCNEFCEIDFGTELADYE